MCKWGSDTAIHVIRRNHESFPDGWHQVYVDSCIASLIQQMNNQGIITVGCCCGHWKDIGWIQIDPVSEELLKQNGYSYELVQIEYLDSRGKPYTEPYLFHYLPMAKKA